MIKKMSLVPLLAASMMLQGCAGLGALMGGPPPAAVQTASAPLAGTRIDETAYRAFLRSVDVLRQSVDALVAARVLVRNSPRALQVREGLVALRAAVVAVDSILEATNNPVTSLSLDEFNRKRAEYRAAIADAQEAIARIGAAIRGE